MGQFEKPVGHAALPALRVNDYLLLFDAFKEQAISCLVDEKYFGGSIVILAEVRDTVRLPVLYKEFVVDEWQVWQAASLGCAAVLLIVVMQRWSLGARVALYANGRMLAQLLAVGYVLTYVFDTENPWVVAAVMVQGCSGVQRNVSRIFPATFRTGIFRDSPPHPTDTADDSESLCL